MDESLKSRIHDNLVAGRAAQFLFLRELIRTPLQNPPGDTAAVAELTAKTLKSLGFGVERHNVPDGIFNCGFQNMSIMDIAQLVKKIVEEEFPEKGEIDIETTPTDDIRSYHINSDKIKRVLGFEPKHSIEEAVRDLCRAFKEGNLPDSFDGDQYYNVRTMQAIGAK